MLDKIFATTVCSLFIAGIAWGSAWSGHANLTLSIIVAMIFGALWMAIMYLIWGIN